MMKPTDEQLKDPKWWDENAPEGATHFDTKFNWFCNENGFWNSDLEWHPIGLHVDWGTDRYTPRPTKPAAPEWDGEGLPPVGCECEVSYTGYWVKAKVVHSTASGILVSEMFGKFPGKVHISVDPRKFRPLRTKEQRQREELIKIIGGRSIMSHSFEIADDIIEAGYRKERQDD